MRHADKWHLHYNCLGGKNKHISNPEVISQMNFLERSVCSVALLGSSKPGPEVPLNQTQKLDCKAPATVLSTSITNNLSAPSLPKCSSISWGKICSLGNRGKNLSHEPDPQEHTVLVFNCNKQILLATKSDFTHPMLSGLSWSLWFCWQFQLFFQFLNFLLKIIAFMFPFYGLFL